MGSALSTNSTTDKVLLRSGVAASVLAVALCYLVIPKYAAEMTKFGVELPPITTFVFRFYPLAWAIPAAVAATWLLGLGGSRRSAVACAIGIGGLVVVILANVAALYLAVASMASSI